VDTFWTRLSGESRSDARQFEGAAVFGTSVVRSGEITATKGAINQSNFRIIRWLELVSRLIRRTCISSIATLPGGRR